jgi:hypothetical protein
LPIYSRALDAATCDASKDLHSLRRWHIAKCRDALNAGAQGFTMWIRRLPKLPLHLARNPMDEPRTVSVSASLNHRRPRGKKLRPQMRLDRLGE